MTSGPEPTPEIAAELARLRALERSLRSERERIRAAAAEEVARLQTALRESAARASQREREVQALTGELQKRERARPLRARRVALRPGRGDDDVSGALERVLATFDYERQQLEARARAVAETEQRQRAAAGELQAEAERLAAAEGDLEERRGLSSELQAADKRIAKLERQLEEHNETRASLKAATVELAALGKAAQERREAEAALLATRGQLAEVERQLATASGAAAVAHAAGHEREAEEGIEELIARRERELRERADADLAVRREQLEHSMSADLDRRRDELESDARADLARREQELAAITAAELARRRTELEREAAEANERVRAGGDERLSRERAGLQEELHTRERELSLHEADVTRREIELAVVLRRVGEQERRVQERSWRTGTVERRPTPAVPGRPTAEPSFSEGWRLLSRGRDGRDSPGGSW